MSYITMTKKRLMNERKQVESKEYTLSELQETPSKLWWDMTFHGPANTPYEGMEIVVRVEYESGYPFRSPFLVFQTSLNHPNIHPSGLTSNLLNEPWSPSYTIQTLYDRIQHLLAHPIPEYRLNPNA